MAAKEILSGLLTRQNQGNTGGTFKDITSGKVYVSGVWKNIVKGHLYVSGVWKEMF